MGECSGNCSSCKSSGSGCGDEKLTLSMSRIQHKILVMSGKGGVGKSTVAASLAIQLAQQGKKVGLLDVDFHGPSQPTLFGIQNEHPQTDGDMLVPIEKYGVKVFSIGNLMEDPDSAVVWRGPAKIGVLKQLLEDVMWGDLDVLVFDFPPGTGDEALSACQMVKGDKAAIVVTTPQEVSLADCRKCLNFCSQLQVPVLGIVENMSYFICPDCKKKHEIFLSGGGKKLADGAGVPLLARIPLDPVFLQKCDAGNLAEGLKESAPVAEAMRTAAAAI